MKLYLKLTSKDSFASPRDLINFLFSNGRGESTIFARATYYDFKCKKIQCLPSRRSFEDMLALVRTYFPNTRETTLAKIIRNKNLNYSYCGDINKIVFRNGPDYFSYPVEYESNLKQYMRGYVFLIGTYTPSMLYNLFKKIKNK